MVFTKAIIHCSDSDFGDVLVIDKWHKERGWDGIGYHYVILNGVIVPKQDKMHLLDGVIEPGRSLSKKGAHCKGHNDTVGICLIGKKKFTHRQFNALAQLIGHLYIKKEDIFPHSHFDSGKTCPNFSLENWKNAYLHF